jgi:hypothetical protein
VTAGQTAMLAATQKQVLPKQRPESAPVDSKVVCEHCGEATFSRETTEHIRRMVHGAGHPVKTVPMDVFAMV